jgi:polyisoprenoid-binding protein YceI
MTKTHLFIGAFLVGLMGCSPKPEAIQKPAASVTTSAPQGMYHLDKSHASLLFRVNHLGFSRYTARFTRFDAQLDIDPKAPQNAKLTATVDVSSLETDYPTPKVEDFNKVLIGETWLDAKTTPVMQFVSQKITLTSTDTADIEGLLTLKGVTKPVRLVAKFNGGYAGFSPYDPNARIGFSASGSLNRSDFGVSYGIPEKGSTMGVSDRVEIIIEAEFSGPALAQTPDMSRSRSEYSE